ncbi:hypothetical protein FDY95_16950 [Hymenobacter jeollabukensis]|uniref:Signal transduction histidine kinase internal region domain-containing protein n=2 Tax=Hymenobacter jeollabukensis TaxID=2025313 RepID=A0A5R8WMT5_9BACT|nr:hypothetical protein FDY95_16950 [Hymenobacter jeollabukensis]
MLPAGTCRSSWCSTGRGPKPKDRARVSTSKELVFIGQKASVLANVLAASDSVPTNPPNPLYLGRTPLLPWRIAAFRPLNGLPGGWRRPAGGWGAVRAGSLKKSPVGGPPALACRSFYPGPMPTLLARAFSPLFGSAPWPAAEPVTSRRVPLWAHAVLWSVLLLTDALQIRQMLSTLDHTDVQSWALWQNVLLRSFSTDALYAAIFYLNWRELIPRLLARGRVAWYALGVLLLLTVFVGLRVGASRWVYSTPADMPPPELERQVIPYALTGLMMIFLSSALRVTGDYLQERHNRRELERRQLLTELSLLKMQVNPHFLFNTLNNIYALASQKSDRAPEAVLRLAEIMRYMLYESAADTVPLSQELQHLRSFLALQQLRLPATGAAAIVFDDADLPAAAEWPVAPMLLLPLVENAFKHGDLTARPAVQIRLGLTAAGALQLVVDNAVAPEPGGAALEASGGVGLVNLRRRLELLYPGRHELRLETPPGHYRAALTLLPGPVLG